MAERRILLPQSLPDLLTILKRRESCRIWAGGTWLGPRLDQDPGLLQSEDLVCLSRIDELRRIYRTERFLDVGALCTLDRLVQLESSVVPVGLRQAILCSIPSPARNLATLGGNLAIPLEILSLLPWCAAADSRLEIRRQGGQRFLPVSRFLDEAGLPRLEPGEVISRIRIPMGRWNHQTYRRIGLHQPLDTQKPQTAAPGLARPGPGPRQVAFMVFAQTNKDRLEDIRLCLAFSNLRTLSFSTINGDLAGQRLPLGAKTVELHSSQALGVLNQRFPSLDPVDLDRIRLMFQAALEHLPRA